MQLEQSVNDLKWGWFFRRYSRETIAAVYDSVDRTLEMAELLPDSIDSQGYFETQMAQHNFGSFSIRNRPISFKQAREIYRAIEGSDYLKKMVFPKKSPSRPSCASQKCRYTDEQIEFMQMNPDIDPVLLPYIKTDTRIFYSPEESSRCQG